MSEDEIKLLERIVTLRQEMLEREVQAPASANDMAQMEIDLCEAQLRLLAARKAIRLSSGPFSPLPMS